MANNYCELSAMLEVPADKLEQAKAICLRVEQKLEEEDYCNAVWEVERDGIWFHHDESADPDHVAEIARAVIEELELDEPFYCSWAYTCSKPRIDEFGGGAFVIKRGKETQWVDAMNRIRELDLTSLPDLNSEREEECNTDN